MADLKEFYTWPAAAVPVGPAATAAAPADPAPWTAEGMARAKALQADVAEAAHAEQARVRQLLPAAVTTRPPLAYPQGFIGALAGYVFRSAPRPVTEVALAAALAWNCGALGKAWDTGTGSGLNAYILCVADSGMGKEALHTGLSKWSAALRAAVLSLPIVVDQTKYQSAPALAKALSAMSHGSTLNLIGEVGKLMKRMTKDRDDAAQGLRTLWTDLYQKSGRASVVGGLGYSDKSNNTHAVTDGFAFSLLGETVPDTFEELLTPDMMSDGFLSRFTTLEATGVRPPQNKAAQANSTPSADLVDYGHALLREALYLLQAGTRGEPLYEADAEARLDAFDLECDARINATRDQGMRQAWNRAHLKVLKFSDLQAITCRPLDALQAGTQTWQQPRVTLAHVEWAIDLVMRDIERHLARQARGDIGVGDTAQEAKLGAVLRDYAIGPAPGFGATTPEKRRELHSAGIVTRKFLQQATRVKCFIAAPFGPRRALDEALRSMVASGYLVQMDKTKSSEQYGFEGDCYRIVTVPGLQQ